MARNADLEFRIDANVTGIPEISRAQRQMKSLEGQMTRAGRAVNQYGGHITGAQRKTRRFAMGALQQAGYQIGDYAVQVANGTSRMQAFGQQGSQLLGIFGPIGAILGAGVAIFSALGIAASKSGASVGSLGSALGVLQEPLSSIGKEVASLRGIFSGSLKVMVQNIDTALIAVGVFAAYMGGKYVVSLAASTAATATFSGAMYGLGVAIGRVQVILARFLPFALMLGIAKLIEMFLQLKKGAGGFGNAIKLVGDLGSAVFSSLWKRMKVATLNMTIAFMGFKRSVFEALKGIAERFDGVIDGFVSKWNNSVGEAAPKLKINIDDWSIAGQLTDAIGDIDASIEIMQDEISKIGEPTADIREAWDALVSAFKAGATEITLFGAAAEDSTSKAGSSVLKLTDKYKSLKDSIKSSMESAFMSMVDGTKSTKDAFRSMAREIISELYRVLVVQRMVAGISRFLGFNQMSGPFMGIGSSANFMPQLAPRAMGGPVTAGKPYLVGERRPEMFVPSRNGYIEPSVSGGQSIIINQSNTFGDGVSRGEISAMLPKIVETTKAAVFDAQRRSVSGRGY